MLGFTPKASLQVSRGCQSCKPVMRISLEQVYIASLSCKHAVQLVMQALSAIQSIKSLPVSGNHSFFK
jgi:hypothetical protein